MSPMNSLGLARSWIANARDASIGGRARHGQAPHGSWGSWSRGRALYSESPKTPIGAARLAAGQAKPDIGSIHRWRSRGHRPERRSMQRLLRAAGQEIRTDKFRRALRLRVGLPRFSGQVSGLHGCECPALLRSEPRSACEADSSVSSHQL